MSRINSYEIYESDVPLIWTSKGNLPISKLRYDKHWEFNEDHIAFVEEYFLKEESVKRAVHIKLLKMPDNMEAIAGLLARNNHG